MAGLSLADAAGDPIDALFSSGSVVYRGYVDDPRNTDNAWMETTATHCHCDELLASKLVQ